jgi:hypothetical protein
VAGEEGVRRFSERAGFRSSAKPSCADELEPGLRNRLWNLIWSFWLNIPVWNARLQDFVLRLWDQYFKRPTDELVVARALPEIRKYFFAAPWYEVFDFVEFCVWAIPEGPRRAEFVRCLNQVLEEEGSAYRFAEGGLVGAAAMGSADDGLRRVSQEVWEALDCLESWQAWESDEGARSTRDHLTGLVAALPPPARSLLGAVHRVLGSVLESGENGDGRTLENRSGASDPSATEMRLALVLCALLLRFLGLRWRRLAQSVGRELPPVPS